MGQWVEDPKEQSGWRWNDNSPPGDPTVTRMLPVIGYQPADVDPNLMPPEDDEHQHGGDE